MKNKIIGRSVSYLIYQKIFERCMYEQLKGHFDKLLSKYQCGFRKGFNTQHCLLAMIKKLPKIFDIGEVGIQLLFYLSL